MPITHTAGATTFTGASIDYYRLCVLKSAVALELKGLRVRRGPLVWPAVKRQFNLKGGKEAVYAWLVAAVISLRDQQEHIDG
jgi:hypothetical protein